MSYISNGYTCRIIHHPIISDGTKGMAIMGTDTMGNDAMGTTWDGNNLSTSPNGTMGY